MRRKNISEELEINKDITLNDGSELKPEEEKVAEEVHKEVQDLIDEKNEILDEIREAEAVEVEANDGLGKSTVIKQFVEKLILDEPSDVLIEEVNTFDLDERDEAVHAVYNALAKYANFLYFDLQIEDEDSLEDFDLYGELEDVVEEVMMRLNDGEWLDY